MSPPNGDDETSEEVMENHHGRNQRETMRGSETSEEVSSIIDD